MYIAGSCPLVLTCPHDGHLRPADMPDRDPSQPGVVVCNDDLVAPLTIRVRQLLLDRHHLAAHLVINNLDRIKVDMNRSEARACSSESAATLAAYRAYHGKVRAALDVATRQAASQPDDEETTARRRGYPLLLDFHGQDHPEQWLELGYGIKGSLLDSGHFVAEQSTLKCLQSRSGQSLADLISGPCSLGAHLESRSVPVVPSPGRRSPGPGANYYSGAYTVHHYSSAHVDCIQLENPDFVRCKQTGIVSDEYCSMLADSLADFVRQNGYVTDDN